MDTDGLFVHVNDSIRMVVSQGPASETWEFICECADVSCHALVPITLGEFDERRSASPPLPIVALEHSA